MFFQGFFIGASSSTFIKQEEPPQEGVPLIIGKPVITGIPVVPNVLSASAAPATGGSIVNTWQWKRDGVNITDATDVNYTLTESDYETSITVVQTATNTYGFDTSESEEVLIPAAEPTGSTSLSKITSNHTYNAYNDKMLIYTPAGHDEATAGTKWPLILFYHGNGERGRATTNTFTVTTGANGSQTNWSGNLNNTQRIIHSEVNVEVNDVVVATGRFGNILGDGVSGTYNYDDGSSASYTLNFTSAPANGSKIEIVYTQSNLLGQGPFRYLNLLDEPNLIFAAPQINRSSGEGGFEVDTEWDDAIDYLVSHGYKIDLEQIYVCGLSLGTDLIMKLFNDRNETSTGSTYTFAAFVAASPGSDQNIPNDAAIYLRSTNKGKLIVRGTSDNNGSWTGFMANGNGGGSLLEFPCQMLQYWGIGHSSSLWDNKVFNRRNRTNTTGLADFDYIDDFLLLFHLNPVKQAEKWVERAETTLDSGDYRVAVRSVYRLSASSKKTELENRLSAVKSSIGRMATIDIGTSFRSSTGNTNNLTSSAASTSISNLIDIDGSNTGWSFTCVNAPASSPGTTDAITRVEGKTWGFPNNTNRDGHRIGSEGTTGLYRFAGLNTAKTYTIKVYSIMSNNSFSSRAEVEVTCNSTTKYAYCDLTNFFASDGAASGNYVIYKNVTPNGSGQIDFTIQTRQTASTERQSWLQAAEIIEEA